MKSVKKIASVAVVAAAGLMLIAAFALPTIANAQPPQNPKTTTTTETLDFRLNPQGQQIPGSTEITTTTTEACTHPVSGTTPPGQAPEEGQCEDPFVYSCEQTVTTTRFTPSGEQQGDPTIVTTQC